MSYVKRVVLDVLKPHRPNALEFAEAIAKVNAAYYVKLTVLAVDADTESIEVIIEANSIDFVAVQSVIGEIGGSIHSIDQVEV